VVGMTVTDEWCVKKSSMQLKSIPVHYIYTHARTHARTHAHTHTRLTALFQGLPRCAGTRKVKLIWILLEQETASGSGISRAICKSTPRSRQTTMPAPHHSVFTDRMPFLPPNQQRQSTEGIFQYTTNYKNASDSKGLLRPVTKLPGPTN